jgi:hypothetical protein
MNEEILYEIEIQTKTPVIFRTTLNHFLVVIIAQKNIGIFNAIVTGNFAPISGQYNPLIKRTLALELTFLKSLTKKNFMV